MLAIRMQRTGRKGHAMFRVVVQDSRRTPSSGKVVAYLGSYDPHAKAVTLDKDKAGFYLKNGAQPSSRAARLLQTEGVALPSWVSLSGDRQRSTRNADKRRSTRPPEAVEAPAAVEDAPIEEAPVEAAAASETPETPAAESAEAPVADAEAPAESAEPEPTAETPAE